MALVKYIGGIILWIMIGSIIGLEIILGALFLSKSQEVKTGAVTDLNSKEGNYAMCAIFWILAFFTCLYICCMWKRIKLAIAVLKVIIIFLTNYLLMFIFFKDLIKF